MTQLRNPVERARDWFLGSDPGLIRLQMAFQTVLTLAVALLVLELLTTATGEPLTVALLGVVIAMMSSMAVNDPDPVQQKITMGLLPLPAAASVTLGALLATYMIASDVVRRNCSTQPQPDQSRHRRVRRREGPQRLRTQKMNRPRPKSVLLHCWPDFFRPLARPSRLPSPVHWRSSPARCCLTLAGIGR